MIFQAFLFLLFSVFATVLIRALICKKPKAQQSHRMEMRNDREKAVARLSRALQFETIFGHADAFTRLQEYLFQTYPKIFNQFEIQKFGEFALLLKWQGSDALMNPFMFIAHQDVVPVPPGECEHWAFPPFAGKVEGASIHGRGTLDMKSTLLAILEAMNQLLEEGYQPKRTLYLYMGDDEEIGGPTAEKAASWMASQNIHLDAIFDEGGGILEEMVPGMRQPIALVGLAQKGVMNLKLAVKGHSGHAAQPPKATPIDILGAAVAKVMQSPMPIHSHSLVFPLFSQMASWMPFPQRIIMANLWLFKPLLSRKLEKVPFMNAMLRTTAAPTLFESGVKKNVVPEMATANINYRLYPGDTAQTVLKHVETVIKDSKVTAEIVDEWKAVPFSKTDSVGFEAIHETIQMLSQDHVVVAPVLTIGGTDGRHFRRVSDDLYQFLFIRGTMDVFKKYHGKDECISIDNYLNQIMFYSQLMKK